MSGILVPLDGSGFAERALPVAAALARRLKTTIHLIRVHTQLPLWDQGAEVIVLSPETEARLLEQEEQYIQRVADHLENEGVPAVGRVIKGELVPAVREYAADEGLDLVVMTSHGRGGIRRAIVGSVADDLMRTLTLPLLIVPPGTMSKVVQDWPARVLVPLDGSPLAESILKDVRTLLPARDIRLFLTAVVQTIPPNVAPWIAPPELFLGQDGQREQLARRYLESLGDQLAVAGISADCRTSVGGKVAREILRIAELERCDMIAIATHGTGGLDRFMLGSVTDQVVRHARVPVLVARPVTASRSARSVLSTAAAGQDGVA